jgi:hypothetical protein
VNRKCVCVCVGVGVGGCATEEALRDSLIKALKMLDKISEL